MRVFLNGRFLSEDEARFSIHDRALLYGDSLFETLLVWNGKPFRWADHWARLQTGVSLLHLPLPWTSDQLLQAALQLARDNAMPRGVLRMLFSRGTGPRSYSIEGCTSPNALLTMYPLLFPSETPATLTQWRLQPCGSRIATGDPLAAVKSSSRLAHVLARQQAESAGAHAALLCNTDGVMTECDSGNLFWIHGNRLHTPPVSAGALPGVTRALVLAHGPELGLDPAETLARPESLAEAEGTFISMSTLGIVEIVALSGRPLRRSPWVERLHQWYWKRVAQECGGE